MINISTYENAGPVPFNIEAKKMFADKRVEIVKLSIQPGEEIEIHRNIVDVVFYVISGSGILTVEFEKAEVYANSTVFVEKNFLRGWVNNSESILELLVVKLFSI